VRYLLDSGVWLRSALNAETLPADIRAIVGNQSEILALSVFSLWEAAKKHQKGKLPLPTDLAAWLHMATPDHLRILPLSPEIIVEATRLPVFPVNDPADELIVATARIHRLTLITTDTKLRNYSHAKIHYFTPGLKA
jgi:PIN domain nuclease of toxin-antitoxin system